MRYELDDYEWGVIQPVLPNKPRGVPRVDDRRVPMGAKGSPELLLKSPPLLGVFRPGRSRRDSSHRR